MFVANVPQTIKKQSVQQTIAFAACWMNTVNALYLISQTIKHIFDAFICKKSQVRDIHYALIAIIPFTRKNVLPKCAIVPNIWNRCDNHAA